MKTIDNPTNKIIVITGPTATGKTALGARLAKQIGGEVVSADSMQVYKYMDIGTAKPTEAEMLGMPHHMISIVHPSEDYSVSRYVENASKCVDDILQRGKTPIIVGGTGLYIDSLIAGRAFLKQVDAELRQELETEYDKSGGDDMLRRLAEFDAESASRLHANDKRRIVRAFEVYKSMGKTISQHDYETKQIPPKYTARKFALTFSDREELYKRINSRVDAMVAAGLEDEVRSLIEMGIPRCATSMQAIGYKEMLDAIMGECRHDEAIDKIKMESRRYAKRQLTWLRRDDSVEWITWEKESTSELVRFDKIFASGNL